MALRDKRWLSAKPSERLVEPIAEKPLHMISVILDRSLGPPLAKHVGRPIAIPGFPERNGSLSYRCRVSRALAFCDRSEDVFGLGPRFARGHVAKFANLLPRRKLAHPVAPERALGSERLLSPSNDNDEALQFGVENLVLPLFGVRQAADRLVRNFQ
ncbi:MAG: hypothetical protein WAK69_19985 [Rhodoplanes sp.]